MYIEQIFCPPTGIVLFDYKKVSPVFAGGCPSLNGCVRFPRAKASSGDLSLQGVQVIPLKKEAKNKKSSWQSGSSARSCSGVIKRLSNVR